MRKLLSTFKQWLDRPWRCAVFVFILYFVSSFFASTLHVVNDGEPLKGIPALKYSDEQWVTVGLPRVLRGDECHYLIVAHSLAGDLDLQLNDEYQAVLDGENHMGAYFAGKLMERPEIHVTTDRHGRLIGKHPVGLSVFLALALFPLADSPWMEPAAIWLTAAVGAIGVAYFIRCLLAMQIAWPLARMAGLLLAFATPWFSYSRTLLTEIYIGTGLLMALDSVLRNQVWRSIPAAMFLAWFKYPALLIFLGAGCGEAIYKRYRNFILIGTVGAVSLLGAYHFNKHIYVGMVQRVDMPVLKTPREELLKRQRAGAADDLLNKAQNAAISATPIKFVPGNFLENIKEGTIGKKKGFLQSTPIFFFAAWGMIGWWRQDRRAFKAFLCMLLPYLLIHLWYEWLLTGTNYSLRYLIPCVPLLLLPIPWFMARRKKISHTIFRVAVGWSLVINVIAGVFPAATFKMGPKDILKALYEIIVALFGFGPT